MLAKDLKRRGITFPGSFLEEYIEQGDLNAVLIAGVQGEKDLAGSLSALVAEKPNLEDAACKALSMMGKEGAGKLVSLLRPNNERRNRRVLQALGRCADSGILDQLREMSVDKRFASQRKYFEQTTRVAEGRLKQQRQDDEKEQ
jgi:hypothetical protein